MEGKVKNPEVGPGNFRGTRENWEFETVDCLRGIETEEKNLEEREGEEEEDVKIRRKS